MPVPGEELEAQSYAVVDVETTGGTPARGHRITEVAVVEIRDGFISEDFQTLVNPGRSIPSRIAELTGITDDMVAGAPFFEDVARAQGIRDIETLQELLRRRGRGRGS